MRRVISLFLIVFIVVPFSSCSIRWYTIDESRIRFNSFIEKMNSVLLDHGYDNNFKVVKKSKIDDSTGWYVFDDSFMIDGRYIYKYTEKYECCLNKVNIKINFHNDTAEDEGETSGAERAGLYFEKSYDEDIEFDTQLFADLFNCFSQKKISSYFCDRVISKAKEKYAEWLQDDNKEEDYFEFPYMISFFHSSDFCYRVEDNKTEIYARIILLK